MNNFKAHPWHGLNAGPLAPEEVTAFIEIVPTDTVKYEIDKESGYLKIDRPQLFSNVTPTLYGFIPQTYCGKQVGAFCAAKTNREPILGDGDPLDILVLTEHRIPHGDIILQALPIGGLRMIDASGADDKIIAVLKGDAFYSPFKDITDLPESVVNRLLHYFLTYKQLPDGSPRKVEITGTYGKEEAFEVIRLAMEDYKELKSFEMPY